MLFVFLLNACKPDMILVSIYVEKTLSESVWVIENKYVYISNIYSRSIKV